jgi:hypothetical protein
VTCKLHVLTEYDAHNGVATCRCGAVGLTDTERAAGMSPHWMSPERPSPSAVSPWTLLDRCVALLEDGTNPRRVLTWPQWEAAAENLLKDIKTARAKEATTTPCP